MTAAIKHTRMKSASPLTKYAKRFLFVGLSLTLGLSASTGAVAQELDGDALEQLVSQGAWVADDANWGTWTWNADKTVCLRVFDPDGDCADTGTWKIEGNVLCYELTWFGRSYDVDKNCVTVVAHDANRYEMLYYGGALVSTFFEFSVAE